MPMLADPMPVQYVVGVDTHKDTHTAAVLQAATRRQLAQLTVPATAAGYAHLRVWADQHAAGSRLWAIEGTGSYGAGLTASLTAAAEQVAEVDRVRRPRRGDKNDAIDAVRAAAEALYRRLPQPRGAGHRNALRVLMNCRDSAIQARTAALNERHALIVTVPEPLRGPLRGKSGSRLEQAIADLPLPHTIEDVEARTTLRVLHMLTARIHGLNAEVAAADAELTDLLGNHPLQAQPGIGPISAARILIGYGEPGRIHSEAAFAALAGVSPLEASSGRTVRHRLNRYGDRTLNAALHTIARNRMRHHEETRRYVQKRRAELKTDREILRCIKRALARRIYRILKAHNTRHALDRT